MCGILGCFGIDVSPQLASSLQKSLAHRGPDAQGIYKSHDDQLTLIQTRLSIVDLSSSADQPFTSACGRYVMVYNGEIYNHQTLANEHAIPLRTSSDTEVVIELYARFGMKMPSMLNGMFSGAIYNKESGEVFLFRDRLGIKPMYYWHLNGKIAFASELTALKELIPPVKFREESVQEFLHRGYVSEPRTFFHNIFKFPAGAFGFLKDGDLTIEPYWRPEDYIKETVLHSETHVLQKVEELLRDSVKLRLMSDVPFGTFLSGGADSGLITAMAADQVKEPLHTFNVSFEDTPFDESPFAKAMAEHIGARYHHIHVTRNEVMDNLEQGMDLVGEPFVDSSVFPTMAVSKFAAKHVKMVLSGDGGDELFMGYGAYTWADRMTKHWPYRKVLAASLRATGKARNKRAANVFDAPSKAELPAHIFSQEQNLFSRKEIEEITKNKFRDPYLTRSKARSFSASEEQAFFDLTNYLKDDLLVKVDRASMRYSLEARVPFLDHRLVELALNIDPILKRKNGESKYLIKKIMERYYPNDLIYRQKWGFSIPLEKWMKEFDANQVSAAFEKPYSEINQKYQSGDGYLYNRLYALKVLSRYI